MRDRKKGVSTFYKDIMRYCEPEDFEDRFVMVDESFAKVISYRLCPDIKSDHKFYQVQNGYTNETQRNSFSVEILTCMNIHDEKDFCKSTTEIQEFLEVIYFTFYTVKGRVNYHNKDVLPGDIIPRPVVN